MRRILVEVQKCVRLLSDVKDLLAQLIEGQASIEASIVQLEKAVRELIEDPGAGTVELNFSVSEQNLP